MPPKPSFRVRLSSSQHEENAPAPTSMTMFALPGSLAEDKLRSNIQKTRLSKWNLNIPGHSFLPGPSSTSIAYGMPTPQTPLNMLGSSLGYMAELDTGAANNVVDEVYQSHWMSPEPRKKNDTSNPDTRNCPTVYFILFSNHFSVLNNTLDTKYHQRFSSLPPFACFLQSSNHYGYYNMGIWRFA